MSTNKNIDPTETLIRCFFQLRQPLPEHSFVVPTNLGLNRRWPLPDGWPSLTNENHSARGSFLTSSWIAQRRSCFVPTRSWRVLKNSCSSQQGDWTGRRGCCFSRRQVGRGREERGSPLLRCDRTWCRCSSPYGNTAPSPRKAKRVPVKFQTY